MAKNLQPILNLNVDIGMDEYENFALVCEVLCDVKSTLLDYRREFRDSYLMVNNLTYKENFKKVVDQVLEPFFHDFAKPPDTTVQVQAWESPPAPFIEYDCDQTDQLHAACSCEYVAIADPTSDDEAAQQITSSDPVGFELTLLESHRKMEWLLPKKLK